MSYRSDEATGAVPAPPREPNFARPVAPHRGRIYLFTGLFTAAVFLLVTVGVQIGFIAPSFTTDVVVNLIFGVPVLLLPLVILWTAPGEHRTRLDRAAELVLFYLPYTAGSQIGYELMFLIGHPLGLWTPTDDPGWKWLWWQYGLADTRYVSGNPWIFALEVVGVLTGATLLGIWTRLIRTRLSTESRIRSLWLTFAGVAILMSSTAVYFIAEVGAGFDDIGQGGYGLGFKFIAENVPLHRVCRRWCCIRSTCRSTISPGRQPENQDDPKPVTRPTNSCRTAENRSRPVR